MGQVGYDRRTLGGYRTSYQTLARTGAGDWYSTWGRFTIPKTQRPTTDDSPATCRGAVAGCRRWSPRPKRRSWARLNFCDRCPMPDHPPCQIIPHPLAQSASAPGSRKIFYDSLSSTLRLAALIEWETEIRQAGEAVFNLENLENDENNALRFSHGFAVDFETLK